MGKELFLLAYYVYRMQDRKIVINHACTFSSVSEGIALNWMRSIYNLLKFYYFVCIQSGMKCFLC